ncbi:LytTR family DNA-binding domain-containing protein [Niabella sp. W65]|nr:LytTR family DNA-binding domain-containing protein [Niabella sp. W65]MCH7364080.1 LytTR family DNA-binding domain-containing protein [Niabella sp. W65]ULT39959.1 LytTR family DNA-binding domain-containing protein [Niabella sp. I65]
MKWPIQFSQVLKIKDKTLLIIVTDSRHYGPEAFLLNAVDYILKPFNYERFLQGVHKAAKKLLLPRLGRPYIFIPGDKKGVKIKIVNTDIRYIKAYANYIKIVTESKQYMTYISLSEVLELLCDHSFVRVHKSYIINMHKVSVIDPVSVCLECGMIIPIGNVFKESFLKRVAGSTK